jgi:hypothetical protein
MQTTIPPQSSITLPPSAAPGSARIFIGPDLPPPLDTYVFNAYGFGATKFVAAIVFYANDSVVPLDDLYQFIGVVDNPGLASAVVYGLVQNGAVREFSAGRPAGLTTITQSAGVTTQINELYDDIVMATRSGSSGAIALASAAAASLSGVGAVTISSSANGVTISAPNAATGVINLDAGTEIELQGTKAYLLTQMSTARASADLTLTTARQTVTGATVTLPTTTANALYSADIECDVEETVAGTVLVIGELDVDGTVQTQAALWVVKATDRLTISQHYSGVLATAGNHTFTVKGSKGAAVGTVVMHQTHSLVRAQIFESGG